jgi:peptide/nickel transport system permease protein
MTRYLVRRLLEAVPLLLGVIALTFVLVHVAPGDPVRILAGDGGDEAYYATMRAKFGLDRPLPEQLVIYLGSALHGDFGYSYVQRRPVFDVIADRIPATALLMLTALAVSTLLGLLLGIVAARCADTPPDHAITIATLVGAATPAFWLGQVLVLVFAAGLGWLPVQGMTSARGVAPGFDAAIDLVRHLVLPVATLGFLQLALITRITRNGLIDVLREEYIRTAYAKGLAPATVIRRHALRNVLLPVVTIVGSHFGTLLTGAVLTEIIFAWPGLGRLLFDATTSRDYPLLMAMLLVASLSVIVANLLTDIAYTALDPRVRLT